MYGNYSEMHHFPAERYLFFYKVCVYMKHSVKLNDLDLLYFNRAG